MGPILASGPLGFLDYPLSQRCTPGVRWNARRSPRKRRVAPASGPRRRRTSVHQGDSPLPRRFAHPVKACTWSHHGRRTSQRVGAAASGAVGHSPSHDHTLECEGHYRASTCRTPGARTAQPPGGQRCGTRRCGGAQHPLHKKARRDGRHTGSSLGGGEHKGMDRPGATNHSGLLHARLGWPAAWPGVRVTVCGHNRACARAASTCMLDTAVSYPEALHRAAWQRTNRPLQTDLGSTTVSHT